MLYILFIITVAVVVTFAILISDSADWFEKNTKLNGALIGFLLAATTSIPELVSGITSVFIGQHEIAISSILGSNLFNYNIVVVANLSFISYMTFNNLKPNTNKINVFILAIYSIIVGSVLIGFISPFTFFIDRISIISILIFIVYLASVYFLKEDDEGENELAPRNIVVKKIIISVIFGIILIISSSVLARLVEEIMIVTKMSASLAGSVLLGASTSLPELVGAFTLMRKRQYDIAVSSVLSSNLFNFFVLGILDLFAVNKINSYFTTSTYVLLVLGFVSTIIIYLTFRFYKPKNKILYAIPSVLVLAVYSSYLIFFT